MIKSTFNMGDRVRITGKSWDLWHPTYKVGDIIILSVRVEQYDFYKGAGLVWGAMHDKHGNGLANELEFKLVKRCKNND